MPGRGLRSGKSVRAVSPFAIRLEFGTKTADSAHYKSKALNCRPFGKADEDMKQLMAVAVIALAGLASGNATAQAFQGNARFLMVQYEGGDLPPVPIAAVYNVNGVNYPVDYDRGLWGRNAYGVWVVIGFIEFTPDGVFAVSGGVRYPAIRVE